MATKKGILFVVSAPSGAGKTSLLKAILAEPDQNLELSISHTSRSPRTGEQDKLDYFFVSKTEFERLIEEKHFLEYAKVHGNYYGTSLAGIKEKLAHGINIILEIDVQGAEQVRKILPDAVLIFIFPPSLKVLKQRLMSRNLDSQDVINLRVENAREELLSAEKFDYFVINDDFELAKLDLNSIFIAERLAVKRNQDIFNHMIEDL